MSIKGSKGSPGSGHSKISTFSSSGAVIFTRFISKDNLCEKLVTCTGGLQYFGLIARSISGEALKSFWVGVCWRQCWGWQMARLCHQYPRLVPRLWGVDGLDTISASLARISGISESQRHKFGGRLIVCISLASGGLACKGGDRIEVGGADPWWQTGAQRNKARCCARLYRDLQTHTNF